MSKKNSEKTFLFKMQKYLNILFIISKSIFGLIFIKELLIKIKRLYKWIYIMFINKSTIYINE